MKKFALLLGVFVIFSFSLFAQKVVVSEYNNVTGDPLGEWTELLVVEDNVDLVGYTLRDNEGSNPPPSNWQGGVRFKDHPLWRHLRAGTIIVINHRYAAYQSVDVDKRDGYIEIDAENETYFEKRCFNCILGPEWYQRALNIAQQSDIIELIDQNDNHVHALAHLPEAKGDWVNMPAPKIAYVGSIPRGGVTVRVCPGRTLAAYNNGFDTRSQEVTQSADYVTKGKPNNRAEALDVNQLFWRSLREPVWNSPSAVAKVFADSIVLSWNAVTDPYPNDSVTGYIILRIPYESIGSATPPIDGKIYRQGDMIGPGMVVGVVNFSQTTRFVDKFQIPCGSKYVYRIFAFRYREDDFHEDTREVFARGRSYNERNFAEVIVEKALPPKPMVTKTPADRDTVCKGDLVVLRVSNFSRTSGYTFTWIKDGNVIYPGNIDTLNLVEGSGEYYVRVTDSLGCYALSEPIKLTFLEYPQLEVLVNGKKVSKDTLCVLCPNQALELKAIGWFSYSLYRGGAKIYSGNNSSWNIDSAGIYWVTAENYSSKGSCVSSSPKIEIRYLNLKIELNPKRVDLVVGKNEVYKDTIITVKNQSDTIVHISNVKFTDTSFQLLSPALPITLLPREIKEIVIRFKPERSGKFSSFVIFEKDCNLQDTLQAFGEKEKSVFILSSNQISFGIIPDCYSEIVDSSFVLIVDFGEEVEVLNARIQFPFEILSPKLPLVLKPNDRLGFKIKLLGNQIGKVSGELLVVYSYTGLVDTLIVPVEGLIEQVKYELTSNIPSLVVFDECENVKSFKIGIKNSSKLSLNLELVPSNSSLVLMKDKFVIDASDSLTIPFELKPKSIGKDSVRLVFKIEPCNLFDTLIVNFDKKGIVVTFSADTIDFGLVTACNKNISISKIIKVSIQGDNLGLTKVEDVDVSLPFKFTFPKDSLLKDGDSLAVQFLPDANGDYFDEVKVKLAPCHNEYKFFVRGKFVRGDFAPSHDTLDFGDVEVGSSVEKYVVLNNIGESIINYDSTKVNPTPGFAVTKVQPYVKLVPIDDSLKIFVKFNPSDVGEFVSILEVHIGFPCDTIVKILLKGKGIAPKPENLVVSIDNYRFRPFAYAKVPITYEMNSSRLDGVDSIQFTLKFNPRVFYLKKILADDYFTKTELNSISGTLKITANPSDRNKTKGVVCILEGDIYLGDEKTTFLRFTDAKLFGSPKITLLTNDGSITIDSVCEADLRLISNELLPDFTLFASDGEIIFSASSTQKINSCEITLYNLLGQSVYRTRLTGIQMGNYRLKLPFEIKSGVYLATVVVDGIRRTYYLVIFE
jgi:hypothetical protein